MYATYLLDTHIQDNISCTLTLHDSLPISPRHRRGHRRTDLRRDRRPRRRVERGLRDRRGRARARLAAIATAALDASPGTTDRKSTLLNSSHMSISYSVFCLKIKMTINIYK